MVASLGADTKKVRNINRTIVLNIIRDNGAISKAAIARQTGISFSTVNRVVEELLQEDLIQQAQDRLDRGGGRPGEVFEFNGKSHFVIGIDLGVPNIRGMIADLAGTTHKELTIPVEVGNGPENYHRLLMLVEQLQSDFQEKKSQISGIGLGVAGIVDQSMGVVIRSQLLGWENFPLARRLQKDTGMTLFLDNDINLITMGEYGFGIGQGIPNLVCITLGTRVLCGFIVNGEIYRGSTHNSGRLDHFIHPMDLNCAENAGQSASLESLISSPSILNAGVRALESIDPQRADRMTDPKLVYQAARSGEPWAVQVFENVLPALAATVGNLSLLLDPEMIVISGRMADEAVYLVPLITNYLIGKIPHVPHIETSPLGTRSTVLGAIMLVYRGILHNW